MGRRSTKSWRAFYLNSFFHYRADIIIVVICVLLSVFSLHYKVLWCQLQAYTTLALVLVSIILYVEQHTRTEHGTAQIRNHAYCIDCSAHSKAVIFFGATSASQESEYERLFPRPFAAWLFLSCWTAWICYGTLFHEGLHVIDENSLLKFVGILPESLRGLRVLLMFMCAIVSCVVPSFDRLHTALLVLFALFPDAQSTPQALSTLDLSIRALVFFVLFLLSEAVERTGPYVSYAESYVTSKSPGIIMSIVAMASSSSNSHGKLNERFKPHVISPTHPWHNNQSDRETVRLFTQTLRNSRSVRRAAWVLICTPLGYWMALTQAIVCLLYNYRQWKTLHALLLNPNNKTIKRPGQLAYTNKKTDSLSRLEAGTLAPLRSQQKQPKKKSQLHLQTKPAAEPSRAAAKRKRQKPQTKSTPKPKEKPSLLQLLATGESLASGRSPTKHD